jgi:hypothetical protein
MSTTTTIRSIGHICRETGIPYAVVAGLIDANGIVPALIDNGCRKFDDAAFRRIVVAHAALTIGGSRRDKHGRPIETR